MLDWLFQFAALHAGLLFGLTVVSLLSVVLSMTLGVRLVARLPSDYFVNPGRRGSALRHYPMPARVAIQVGRNLLGIALIVAGLLMLVLPGQGVLTLMAGVLVANFPGKYALERWLVHRPQVRAAIDWLRRKSGEPPLILD